MSEFLSAEYVSYYYRACLEIDRHTISVNDVDEFRISMDEEEFARREKDIFWSVYGRDEEGLSMCISDHEKEDDARKACDYLNKELRKKGATAESTISSIIIDKLLYPANHASGPIQDEDRLAEIVAKAAKAMARYVDIKEHRSVCLESCEQLAAFIKQYAARDRLADMDAHLMATACCLQGYLIEADVSAAVKAGVPDAERIAEVTAPQAVNVPPGLTAAYFYSFQRQAQSSFCYGEFANDCADLIADAVTILVRDGKDDVVAAVDDAVEHCEEIGEKFDLIRPDPMTMSAFG